ncbi:peptidase [Clostridium polyendosporum]|uniref:Peptidase n=1 Tax=Clostridium polyendosporum TaxID=69208 RepID=A0A919S0J6_9CLOT|nr:M20/M25/M40 family metallo-hydrolase [Clostridium polyendosporum]GIM29081.1 peptidase [Clostridium polyendosporum]
MIDKVKGISEILYDDMIDFARRLIKCPSLSGEEEEISQIYIDEMKKLNYDEVFRDEWGNVVGIVYGTEKGPTIMFNAHMDHVDPGDLSEWNGYDPYGAAVDIIEMENEDRTKIEMAEVIHGRAAADVKGGAACQIYSGGILAKLKKLGYSIKGNFMFTGVVLEEPAEQLGMIKLIDETLPERNLNFDGVVSCEATGLKLYLGHRGRVELKITVSGITSHGSAPWLGVNAVNKATKIIDKIEEYYSNNYLQDQNLGKSSIALTIINCTPGALCIVPDRCMITYDRRFVPGETAESCLQEIQNIIDDISKEDKDFRAEVEISAVPRTSYTGKTATIPNVKEAWKIDKEHPFVKAAADGLKGLGEPVMYGYWDFGTDLSVICGRVKKPAIGYSPMQELYCHRPIDRVRTDYMKRALTGNVSIFMELVNISREKFKLD